MCVIVIKPEGAALPDRDAMLNCWSGNPHGAGYMYPMDGRVRIRKGFMELDELMTSLDEIIDMESKLLIVHFRHASHGHIIPANTHPFPVSDSCADVRALDIQTHVGIAHNGIIRGISPREGYSDTQEFIMTVLAPCMGWDREYHKTGHCKKLLELTQSKYAWMDGSGEINSVGELIEYRGCRYSNDSYVRKIK